MTLSWIQMTQSKAHKHNNYSKSNKINKARVKTRKKKNQRMGDLGLPNQNLVFSSKTCMTLTNIK